MKLSKDQLLFDLYVAYYEAKKHKNSKPYVIEFSNNLNLKISQLRDDLWNRTYVTESSSCFIIDHPKKREVYDNNNDIICGITCVLGFGLALLFMTSFETALLIWGASCLFDNIGWGVVYLKNKKKLIENE